MKNEIFSHFTFSHTIILTKNERFVNSIVAN